MDGSYGFAKLRPAHYPVEASAVGFVPGLYVNGDGESPYSFELQADESRRHVDVLLRQGGAEVRGVVEDIGGGAVAGAWVTLQPGRRNEYNYGKAAGTAISDADGSFSLWVSEGHFQAYVQAEGYAMSETSVIAPGQLISLSLIPESVLAGRVVEASTGKPVSDAYVYASEDGYPRGNSARTDAHGNFRMTRLKPGRYVTAAESEAGFGMAAESVLLGLGETVEGIEVPMFPAYTVSGKVVIEGTNEECQRAQVMLGPHYGKHDTTRGEVVFHGVQPGTYRVFPDCAGKVSQDEYAEVTVVDKDIDGLIWTMTPGLSLRGRLKSESGEPVAGATVSSHSKSAEPKGRDSYSQARTKDDGSFEILGLEAGPVAVAVSHSEYVSQDVETTAEVRPVQGDSLEIVMVPGGAVEGVVLDEDDKPVAGLDVRLNRRDKRTYDEHESLVRDDGTFSFKGLEAGEYWASVSRGDFSSPKGARHRKSNETFKVRLGKTAQTRVYIEKEDATISGLVLDESGKPVSDAFIDAHRESEGTSEGINYAIRLAHWGSGSAESRLTDIDGRFAIEGLGVGRYTVRAYRTGGGEAIEEHVETGQDTTLTMRATASVSGTLKTHKGDAPPEFLLTASVITQNRPVVIT